MLANNFKQLSDYYNIKAPLRRKQSNFSKWGKGANLIRKNLDKLKKNGLWL